MLSMRGMTKDFGGVVVLRGVDFAVKSGEIHALLGANGAGKSTLIKILGGLYDDAGGSIELNGAPLRIRSPADSLACGIGILHQESDLVPDLSVAENIFLGLEREFAQDRRRLFGRVDRKRLARAATDLLVRYQLDVSPTAAVGDLAPSARQVVQIARILALESDVVVFDEPTARLGPTDRERLFGIFRRLRDHGKKIVFVTHYLDEVETVADRATVMRDGRLVETLDVRDTDAAAISRLMVGEHVRRPQRETGATLGPAVLKIDDASKADAFRNVSLEVAAGEIVGLVGHLGSGRHEFSRFVAKTGRVLDGSRERARSSGFGFVPEDRKHEGIFPQLTVEENAGIGLLRGRPLFSIVPRGKMRRQAEDLIAKLQIKTTGPDQVVAALSGGNQQKVVFGRSLAVEPRCYVIECPTVGVDVKAGAELHGAILELTGRGAGVLLSTDDLDEAILLSDRILVMRKGGVAGEFSAADVTRQALVLAMGAG